MRWWERQQMDDLYLSVLSIHKLRYGVERMDEGKRRQGFEGWLRGTVLPMFAGRILAIDAAVADRSGRLLAAAKGSGVDVADAMIAASALVYGMRVATLNVGQFERLGVELVGW